MSPVSAINFKCDQCDYANVNEKGLAQHKRMKHRMLQIDGVTDFDEDLYEVVVCFGVSLDILSISVDLLFAIFDVSIVDPVDCIGCIGCIGSVDCIGCIGCIGSVDCIGCIGCIGSVDCIGCIGCIGSVDCIGCIGCIGCPGCSIFSVILYWSIGCGSDDSLVNI